MKNKTSLSILILFLLLQTRSIQAMEIFKYPLCLLTGTVKIMRESPAFLWRKANSIHFWKNSNRTSTEKLKNVKSNKEEKYKKSHEDDHEFEPIEQNQHNHQRSFLGYLWYKHGWASGEKTDKKLSALENAAKENLKKMKKENKKKHRQHRTKLIELQIQTKEENEKNVKCIIEVKDDVIKKLAEITLQSEQTKEILRQEQNKYKKKLSEKYKLCRKNTEDFDSSFSKFYEDTNKTLDKDTADIRKLEIELPRRISAIKKRLSTVDTTEKKPSIHESEKKKKIYLEVKEVSKHNTKQQPNQSQNRSSIAIPAILKKQDPFQHNIKIRQHSYDL